MVVLTISADNNIEFSELLNSQLRITTQMKKQHKHINQVYKREREYEKKTEKIQLLLHFTLPYLASCSLWQINILLHLHLSMHKVPR